MIIEAWEPIWGGGQAHVLEISKKLSQNHGCEIDIYTMNLTDKNNKNLQKNNEHEDLGLKIIKTGRNKNFYSFKDRLVWMFEVVREIKKNHKKTNYDIIHAHANLPGIPGKFLSRILNIPIVYTVHGSNFMDIGEKNIYYFIEKFLYTQLKYDLEITVTNNLKKYKNINIPFYIPNGVDIEKFDNARKKYAIKKNIKQFKIIFVGRLDKVKGIDMLVGAVNDIQQALRKKQVSITLVGYGYEENNLKRIVKKLALEDLIEFKGRLLGEELLKEYLTADAFILPSRSEGFPITILEAWAAKLPVLVTAVGENKMIIKNKNDGLIIPPENKELLKKAILEIISLGNLKEMGENGYIKAKTKYDWKNIAKKTYDLYEKITK